MGEKVKAFFGAIWKGLGEKGKFATLIGLCFALPVNIKFTVAFFKGIEYSRDSLINLAVMNCIAMIWFILPSRVSIKGGKGFEIVVED
jgi:hypothetical protein